MFGNSAHHYSRTNKAQSLLELAIFGSLLIMLLGVLINYGLRYNFQQKALQHAFRQAAAGAARDANVSSANVPVSTSNIYMRDVHIPEPANPWGVGQTVPIFAAENVLRNPDLSLTADNKNELPEMVIDIGGQTASFKTQGFNKAIVWDRTGTGPGDPNLRTYSYVREKYEEIYGRDNIVVDGSVCKECWYYDFGDPERNVAAGWYVREREECPYQEGLQVCTLWRYYLKFIDPCGGEIMDRDMAVKLCRQIVDPEVCKQECEKGRSIVSEPGLQSCADICNATMSPPNQDSGIYDRANGGAWYCANRWEKNPLTDEWVFPDLERLFSGTYKAKAMGLQPDYTKTYVVENSLLKNETPSKIVTSDIYNTSFNTTRQVTYIPITYFGYTKPPDNLVPSNVTINTTRQLQGRSEWTTEQ
ncbi:hypothetical protein ACFL1K_04260 [Candidatus Omnitrophota bacterium]